MSKRILSLLIVISFFAIPVSADISFTDIGSDHWGYSAVLKLVSDGTVKGYEDGSFRPDNVVTRAEFVKMIGKGPEVKTSDYIDVPNTHWAYEYVMASGFDAAGNLFKPDQPITRGETIELLWKRAGSRTDVTAPSIITKQYKNKNAVSWAYNYKIMVGNDGLNLRLNDSLSRVEAAALIIRARETDFNAPQANFADVVSPELLKKIFLSFNLFDNITYDENKTITNGEMARAALRFASYEKNLSYSSFVYTTKFEHPYAKDVTIIGNRCLGDDYVNKEFADKTAVVEDTLAAFAFAGIQKSNKSISFGNINNYYKGVSPTIDSKKNVFLTFAYESGIHLNGDNSLNAQAPLKLKDLAAILLQLDDLVGSQTIMSTKKSDNGKYIKKDVKLVHDLSLYPSNADDFKCIFEGVDRRIYEAPIKGKKPHETYDFAREYGEMFLSTLEKLIKHIKDQYKIDVEFTMYPNLVWDNGSGFTLRVLCNIVNLPETPIDINSIFDDSLIIPMEGNLTEGMEFFIQLNTSYAIFM